jgi:hypothetical protein
MSDDSEVWEPELLESQLYGHDPENELPDHPLARTQQTRGPRRLPVMWSRVISIAEDGDEDIDIYSIVEDIQILASQSREPPPRRGADWAPLFLPTTYAREHTDMTLEHYRLGERRLKTLGIEVS